VHARAAADKAQTFGGCRRGISPEMLPAHVSTTISRVVLRVSDLISPNL
jgi:hypothetical protein